MSGIDQHAYLEEEPESFREPRVERWRTGEAGRTIWWGEHTLHGMVGTPEIAARICHALNEEPKLRAALKAIVDEITDEKHEEDPEDEEAMMESLMHILEMARTALSKEPP